MDQNQSTDILSYVKALTRRIWTILIIVIVGSVLAAAVAYVLPPVYESTARILVESQQIPEDLAQATVRQSVAERLEFIEQRLMTRQNLLAVADRTGLFAGTPGFTPTEKVDLVRDATTFESLTVDEARRGPALVSAFNITYRANNAQLAARVANEFVTMVLEQNIASRSGRAKETYEFFRQEVERLAGELLDVETQMARYKNENGDALPDSLQFRMSELSTLEQRQFERERRRVQLGEQRRMVEQFMNGGFGTPGTPQSPEERQLADLRRALVQKRSILAESHPEIVALKANIGALEASLVPDAGGDPDAGAASEEAPGNTLASAQNQAQLDLIDREMTLIADQQKSDEARAVDIRDSIARTPQVEMALNAYQRRYANLQARYDTVVKKLAEAETGQRLEVNRQAERFEVIEQAQVPTGPVSPNRLLIAGGGAVASLGLAFAIALALELMNPAIRTSADLQRRLQLHPVVTVPYIHTRGERRRQVIKWMIRIALVLGGLAALLWAVDQYVMPLQVLWSRLIDKSGIEELIRMVQARLA